MKRFLLVMILVSMCISSALAQSLTVVAAASMRFAMEDAARSFERAHPGSSVEVVYSSSGKAYAQIINGAPFDMFFSADMHYPQTLHREGHTMGEAHEYAVGRIVLWQRKGGAVDLNKGIAGLDIPAVRRLAIANPELAPYGFAAQEALETAGLWGKLSRRLVMGENISQASHFAASGAAQAGITAYSLALSDDMQRIGEFVLIDESMHSPMPLGFVILKRAEGNALAQDFAAFIVGSDGKEILARYGF